MNTKLRAKARSDFEKNFIKLMSLGKPMENKRKHRDIKLVTTEKRRNYFMSKPYYHTTKWFSENLLAIETNKIKVKMNKPVSLDLSILDISKKLMHEYLCDYATPNYGTNVSYMDMDSFIIHVNMLRKDMAHQAMKLKDKCQD